MRMREREKVRVREFYSSEQFSRVLRVACDNRIFDREKKIKLINIETLSLAEKMF
jgi:hypothetical protein